jgi:predicted PurR-regulated permease PerM
VIWPLLKALLLGAILAGLCHPPYRWLARLFRGRTAGAAAVTVLLLFLLIVGPLGAFLGVAVQQALNVSEQAIPWVQQHFGAASTFDAHAWLARAWEIAGKIMEKPRAIRRLTSAVVRRQWKRRLVQDLGFHVAHELLGMHLKEVSK